MKQKILVLLVFLLSVFALTGCNDTTTTTTTTNATTIITERLPAPTGLAITGTVLSWNAVSGATGYAIYVNDAFQANVTTTSYDFASVSGNQLLFRVVAKAAATGTFIDSVQSASIAYIANATAEIEAINQLMTGFMDGAPEGFAAELVNKGMTAAEFATFKTAVETFQETLPEDGNLTTGNAALTVLLQTDTNIEAMISAFMIGISAQLEQQILDLEDEIEECQIIIDEDGNDYWCYRPISSIESEKATVQMMIDLIEAEKDQMVLVATNAANYFIDLQTHITNTLLVNLQGLMESEGELTASEIIVIKNEIVQMLLDNMPPTADTTLLFQLVGSMVTSLTDSATLGEAINDKAGQFAAMTTASLQLYLNFLQDLDADFVDDILSLQENFTNEAMFQVEMTILLLVEFDAFETANQTLFDAVDNALSAADELALFNAWKTSIGDLAAALGADETGSSIATDVFTNLTYPILVAAGTVDEKISRATLDHMIASDFALLRAQAISESFEYDYWEETYSNTATGVVYSTITAYEFAKTNANLDVMKASINQALAIVEATNTTDAAALIALLVAVIPQDQLQEMMAIDAIQSAALVASINAALTDETADLRTFMLALLNYLVNQNVIEGVRTIETEIHNYYIATYGADYADGYLYYDDSYADYAMAIFMAGHVDAFFTSNNERLLTGFVASAFTVLRRTEVLAFLEITLVDMQEMEGNINQMIADFLAQADVVKIYDVDTLTPEQETAIDDWIAIFDTISEKEVEF
jgi:hypothetical protein